MKRKDRGDRSREQLKGHLDLLLLATLREGPGHGYSLVTRLRERSEGTFDLPEGTVYPALHRLEGDGLLASTWQTQSGRRRRIYTLTGLGVEALATEAQAWRRFSIGVRAVTGWAS
jgi:DNA-binding PadR family transcriptional regulator